MSQIDPNRQPKPSKEVEATSEVIREFVEVFEKQAADSGEDSSATRRLRELLDERAVRTSMADVLRFALEELLTAPPTKARKSEAISDAARQRLRETGMTLEPFEAHDQDPVVRSAMRYARLVESSLTTKTAAKRLGVATSRIRQLLQAPPSLYGFKDDAGSWQLPAFQFTDTGTVPGIRKVIPSLPDEMHPLEVLNWFESANPDLVVEERPVSPLDWLRSGYEPEVVAHLADALHQSA
jgi:hypothetical protein